MTAYLWYAFWLAYIVAGFALTAWLAIDPTGHAPFAAILAWAVVGLLGNLWQAGKR